MPAEQNRYGQTAAVTRRALLAGGTGLVIVSALPVTGHATPEQARAAITALFGETPITEGKVTLKLPPIAENGYSVPLSVKVDSPMTDADHVRRIAVISERNPVATAVQFHLGPGAGRAEVSARMRLAGTQTVQAIAELSDGTLWSGTAKTVVTLAACVIM